MWCQVWQKRIISEENWMRYKRMRMSFFILKVIWNNVVNFGGITPQMTTSIGYMTLNVENVSSSPYNPTRYCLRKWGHRINVRICKWLGTFVASVKHLDLNVTVFNYLRHTLCQVVFGRIRNEERTPELIYLLVVSLYL